MKCGQKPAGSKRSLYNVGLVYSIDAVQCCWPVLINVLRSLPPNQGIYLIPLICAFTHVFPEEGILVGQELRVTILFCRGCVVQGVEIVNGLLVHVLVGLAGVGNELSISLSTASLDLGAASNTVNVVMHTTTTMAMIRFKNGRNLGKAKGL